MDKKHEILQSYFGYKSFRRGQEELVDTLLSGRDALGVMPTGGGKSICYQVPALIFPGVTLVISPLISLMKDQVMSLKAAGVPAAFINSSLNLAQIRKVYDMAASGAYKLIYIAPERLMTDDFLAALVNIPISMVAVDEAHCISEWGQDFRPSYLKIPDFLSVLPSRPVVSAFTATATERVRKDIVTSLGLHVPLITVTGFDRPNLFFDVVTPHKKLPKLLELLEERKGKSGIIYCSTRKQVEKLHEELKSAGVSVTRYHAGLLNEERRNNQENFIYDRSKVMVATNAFGMGIDKSNVSFVIHYNLPKSVEEYYQEAGRAGRDGAPADCILMYSAGDVYTIKHLIENSFENDELTEERDLSIEQNYRRLDEMIGYCKTTGCYREYLLRYFGQKHEPTCDNCGNCMSDMSEVDITTEAKMILSCIRRIQMSLSYFVGQALVIRVLRGSGDKRIKELALDKLSTYGLMSTLPRVTVRQIVDSLTEQGYTAITKPYSTLVLTEKSSAVLFGSEKVTMLVRAGTQKKTALRDTSAQKSTSSGGMQSSNVAELYERLRRLRIEIAHTEGVPAFVIFSNATLQNMAEIAPRNMVEFLTVSGVGEVKAKKYGKQFLDEIMYLEK